MEKLTKASLRKRLSSKHDVLSRKTSILLDGNVIGSADMVTSGKSWSMTSPVARQYLASVPGFGGRDFAIQAQAGTPGALLDQLVAPLLAILREDAKTVSSQRTGDKVAA